jgi:hypothetical protein
MATCTYFLYDCILLIGVVNPSNVPSSSSDIVFHFAYYTIVIFSYCPPIPATVSHAFSTMAWMRLLSTALLHSTLKSANHTLAVCGGTLISNPGAKSAESSGLMGSTASPNWFSRSSSSRESFWSGVLADMCGLCVVWAWLYGDAAPEPRGRLLAYVSVEKGGSHTFDTDHACLHLQQDG